MDGHDATNITMLAWLPQPLRSHGGCVLAEPDKHYHCESEIDYAKRR
jgi:hypothetical protein